MKNQNSRGKVQEEKKIDVRIKLSALWTSFMFLYIYVDYFHLYMPKKIEEITKGKAFVFDISQGFLLTALLLATIPIVMIFVSVLLKPKMNRITNIIIAILLIPYMLFNLYGEAWLHMYFAAVIEVLILILIINNARKLNDTEI